MPRINVIERFHPRLKVTLFALLFLASGFSGLIYQVVWQRQLQLYFGVATHSVILIVAAYMAGLGLGYLWGGHLSTRQSVPLRLYGIVEICIGLFAVFSPQLLTWVGKTTAGASFSLVFLISFILLLVPTVLMGMTLPFLTQGLVRNVETSGRTIGLLYGINTLGAAFGALISGYVLIGAFGLERAVHIGSGINLLVGVMAILLAGSGMVRKESDPTLESTTGRHSVSWTYPAILFAAFLTGFIGMGYEMVWFRILGVINKQSVYSFPTILFALLLGLAIGGYLLGRAADRTPHPTRLLWMVELGVATLASISILILLGLLDVPSIAEKFYVDFREFRNPASPFVLVEGVPVFSPRQLVRELAGFMAPVVLLVLPAGLFMGGGLVILDRISIDSLDMAGRRVGDIHLANIFGSVAGTLITSLVLIPSLSSETTFKILAAMSFVFLLLDWHFSRKAEGTFQPIKPASAMAALVLILVILLPSRGDLFERIYRVGLNEPITTSEGRDSVLTLSWFDEEKTEPQRLWIGGEIHSLFPPSATYQSFALACATVSQPESVLVIGLGGGNTAEFFIHHEDIDEIVIVELVEELPEFLVEQIDFVGEILDDPRVELISDDGRRYLYANAERKFDMIIMDPLRSHTAGSNNLYSLEAMQTYRQHLTEKGVLCAWKDEFHIIPHTAAQVFPFLDDFDRFMIGRNMPISYDLRVMEAYNQKSSVSMRPLVILGSYQRDRAAILAQEKGGAVLADQFPYLEYYFLRPPEQEKDRRNPEPWAEFLQRVNHCDAECVSGITGN